MKIGIDISQVTFEGTGVANYLSSLVLHLLKIDSKNEYVLFFSSLRGKLPESLSEELSQYRNVTIKRYFFPPTMLNFLWNNLHIVPIESLIGAVDVFLSSDWYQPPVKKAKRVTILYDFIVYKYPEETHDVTKLHVRDLRIASNIVKTQKKRLEWVKRECDVMLCISEATKKDAMEILQIDESKLRVVYPGLTL